MADQDQKEPKKRGRRPGRPAWVPPNLDMVKGLAMQAMSDEKIAETLGISVRTLYRKKAQLSQFRQAIKKGNAEGEAVATGKLFAMVKEGNVAAVIFYLKAKCGWRDWPDPAGTNVNVTVAMQEWEKERDKQRELTRLMTTDEKRIYVALLERVAARQARMLESGGAGPAPAVETTAEPVEG